ncbi:right-handed parallel beta-helix repeat-containing protein [Gorillibacterium sp. sgz500922]|uniref:right-handed parallel beta-helix repeat-containing protein n=1 Tax=Gorillibacterium sp. sgz500922 TaxID=3446694 RepID=UPI003F6773BA
MDYHVATHGSDQAPGTAAQPFCTIGRAAALAVPGDTINVHAGIYREWVNPANGGTEEHRIVYQSAGDGEVVITGAEPVADWNNEGDGVWSTELPNTLFAVRNPFEVKLYGDWLFEGAFEPHLGEVYLNGKSLYETDSVEKLREPQAWPQAKCPEDSMLQWYAEAGPDRTKIWANFGGLDPREANVEVNARPYCFWPDTVGRDYITVRGFTLRQASPQWAPPTALQEGLIGPHWSKGWIIEDNVISESKCVGISLGKEIATGQNEWSNNRIKGGTQREQEVIFRALRMNWQKDRIGSHIVRNNVIHDCEQAGIVGHLGCAFSQIYRNRIYHIHHKRLFHGAEVGGIKLHASLDVQISENVISSCYRAVWLDWQAQGTRISRNVFFDNLSEDFFVEVCHGPYTVDHNLFLSPMNFRNMSQGGAFVHNLFAGRFVLRAELSRYTPYHVPHETAVAGYSNITGGDDRYYNNLFLHDGDPVSGPLPMTFFEHLPLSSREHPDEGAVPAMDGVPDNSRCYLYPVGLSGYDSYPSAFEKQWWDYTQEEWTAMRESGKPFEPDKMAKPVAIQGNLYLKGAVPSVHEPDARVETDSGIELQIDPALGEVRVRITDPERMRAAASPVVTSEVLGTSFHAEMRYEAPDGSPYRFDRDFFEVRRSDGKATPGPFELLGGGPVEFVVSQEGVRRSAAASVTGTPGK